MAYRQGLDRRNRQLDGDDIDVDAAVQARVDGLAGIYDPR